MTPDSTLEHIRHAREIIDGAKSPPSISRDDPEHVIPPMFACDFEGWCLSPAVANERCEKHQPKAAGLITSRES